MSDIQNHDPLFEAYKLGPITLPNRILMSPLTRSRAAQPGDEPQAMNVEYYSQRAGAGLILSEATQISPQGKGYAFTPGIYSKGQIDGWRKVTDAVHALGGLMQAQLWHVGRISHPDLQPEGALPVAPSAIKPEGAMTFVSAKSGMIEIPAPRALEADELPGIVDQYRQAAWNAKEAGFDGVQIHAANGYLLDQFMRSGSNKRTDSYGGSAENRIRLTLEVVQAVADVLGADRVGIRISPTGAFNAMKDENPLETFGLLARKLNDIGISYIEVVEDMFMGDHEAGRPEEIIDTIRAGFKGTYIANGNYTADEARQRIRDGKADLVSFGRPYIANPDLAERFRVNAPLNELDGDTLYGGAEKGYTDYPALKEKAA
ncbi:alkene reductase [Aestuariispira insulae]|uniref:N-ethylmaleimide reductase n=1 Tax=Aestuariispira insulae TaxID=1461337 RepID=A0A3D9HJP3_9PROT|nr:alkene reductase [Aestuariispira insulae]RED49717.1 N-ethylmaleimide reductase [Aestuariispira insulae]